LSATIRTQSSLLEIAEVQHFFYKEIAIRTQSSLLEIAEVQHFLCKGNHNSDNHSM
jgi:hypothetical protein